MAAAGAGLAPTAADVVAHIDGCSDELFDIEFRTAARRFLARVAAGDPAIFRRRSSDAMSAAAVCWVVGKANDSFALYHGTGPQVQELMAHFGRKGSVSQRAEVMLRALDIDWRSGASGLRDPGLLTAVKRDRIVRLRDHYRSLA